MCTLIKIDNIKAKKSILRSLNIRMPLTATIMICLYMMLLSYLNRLVFLNVALAIININAMHLNNTLLLLVYITFNMYFNVSKT